MTYENDKRIVLTLDAGGTNFVFSAIQGGKEIVSPISMASNADNLQLCLDNIVSGFKKVIDQINDEPVAISFAFPGPADYPNGIIGDLPNLPAFRGGIALGPMLQEKFKLPVFINNDGNLYAYGEAIGGFLPYINQKLEKAGSPKRFQNLVGFTLGTGFGAGIVRKNDLLIGDNSGGGEVWLLRNKLNPEMNVEEGVSIRAIQRSYAEAVGVELQDAPTPKEIYDIAIGKQRGNKEAALASYHRMAEVLGDAVSNVLTLIDGIAVIGGGLAGAASIFLPKMIEEMNSYYTSPSGDKFRRLVYQAFNLEDENDLNKFFKGESKEVVVPGINKKVAYDPLSRVGVGISKIGTSQAISLGAYVFALKMIS